MPLVPFNKSLAFEEGRMRRGHLGLHGNPPDHRRRELAVAHTGFNAPAGPRHPAPRGGKQIDLSPANCRVGRSQL